MTQAGFLGYGAQFDNTGTYLSAGQYTITGTGGTDVGPFNANLTLPAPLTWTNQASLTTMTRANRVTVTSSGGDPAGYGQITGTSVTGRTPADIVEAIYPW